MATNAASLVERGHRAVVPDREAWLRQFVDYWSGTGAWARLRAEARAEFVRTAWVAYAGARSLVADETRIRDAATTPRTPCTRNPALLPSS